MACVGLAGWWAGLGRMVWWSHRTPRTHAQDTCQHPGDTKPKNKHTHTQSHPQQQRQRLPEAERELDPVLLHLAEARDAAPALVDVPGLLYIYYIYLIYIINMYIYWRVGVDQWG